MSAHPPEVTPSGGQRAGEPLSGPVVDPDGVNGRVVLLVALGTVAVMGLGVAVAWELERTGVRALQADGSAGRFEAPPADMNGIEMSLLGPGVPARERATEAEGPVVQTYALRDPRAPGPAAPGTVAPRAPAEPAPAPQQAPAAPAPAAPAAGQSPAGQASPPAAEPARARLQSYGWSDRERRTVHIPLSRAVELYLARERDAARAAAAAPDNQVPRSAAQPTAGGEP